MLPVGVLQNVLHEGPGVVVAAEILLQIQGRVGEGDEVPEEDWRLGRLQTFVFPGKGIQKKKEKKTGVPRK